MSENVLTAGVIGCGSMGQQYAEAYATLPDTELVAIAEVHPDRRRQVGERHGVPAFADAGELFAAVVPDVVSVVLPGKYIADAVHAAVAAGVRGVSAEKPIGAVLSEVDAMIDACAAAGIVFAGAMMQKAMAEVQQAAARLRAGEFGPVTGACVHRYGGEISGGGCQHVAMLRLLTGAEIVEVVATGEPEEILQSESDAGLYIAGQFRLDNGLVCPVFPRPTPCMGVDVWTAQAMMRWDWAPPQIWRGVDADGRRRLLDTVYAPPPYPQLAYLGTHLQSFVDVTRRGVAHEADLLVSARDLRTCLEVAVAAKHSALWGSRPVSLPLADRSLRLYPQPYRWLGGDAVGPPQILPPPPA